MHHPAFAATDVAVDRRIDPAIRPFLAELNKNPSPFSELPQPQDILGGLQAETPVDMSGVTVSEKTIVQNGRSVKLRIMKPTRDASVESESCHAYAEGRFLARPFMKYGYDLCAPDAKTRDNPYVSPLRDEGEAYATTCSPELRARYGGISQGGVPPRARLLHS